MRRETPYDINAKWDDPCDHRDERRGFGRFRTRLKMKIAVHREDIKGRMIGPGIVRDLSVNGASVITKHELAPGAFMSVTIPTDACPDGMCLPRTFRGPARVLWVTPEGENTIRVGLAFGDRISQDMEFAVFVDYLKSISTLMRAS